MRRLLFAGIVAVILIPGLWLVAVPKDSIRNLIENSLEGSQLQVEVKDLEKGLFYSVSSKSIILKKSDNALVSIGNAMGRVNPFSLFLIRLTLSFRGEIGDGSLEGSMDLLRGGPQVHMTLNNSHMEGIPLFASVGLTGTGILSGEFKSKGRLGDLKFAIRDARFEDWSFSGIPIPLAMFNSGKGVLSINESGNIHVGSFSLEGEGIYARIKGDIRGEGLDLTMELMPDYAFQDRVGFLSKIEHYETSPGYYVLPIRGKVPWGEKDLKPVL